MSVYRLEASFCLFSFSIPLIEDYGGGVKSHSTLFILVWVLFSGRSGGSSFYLHFIWPGFLTQIYWAFYLLFLDLNFTVRNLIIFPRPIFCAVIVPVIQLYYVYVIISEKRYEIPAQILKCVFRCCITNIMYGVYGKCFVLTTHTPGSPQ